MVKRDLGFVAETEEQYDSLSVLRAAGGSAAGAVDRRMRAAPTTPWRTYARVGGRSDTIEGPVIVL